MPAEELAQGLVFSFASVMSHRAAIFRGLLRLQLNESESEPATIMHPPLARADIQVRAACT